MKQPCQKWQGCWCYGLAQGCREGCTERRGCRIASGGIETGAEMRGGHRGVERRGCGEGAFCCNFDLLPHKWGPPRTYCRILRGICATAGVFLSRLTAPGLPFPILRFHASISAPYAHVIHTISFYWTKKHPNACIYQFFVVLLHRKSA